MATRVNLFIDQGATFSSQIDLIDANSNNAIDLSTFTGASQMRRHFSSANSINISVGLSNTGIVTLSLTANQTANIVAGRYVYDVEVTDAANNVSRIVEGFVTVNPNVTRT